MTTGTQTLQVAGFVGEVWAFRSIDDVMHLIGCGYLALCITRFAQRLLLQLNGTNPTPPVILHKLVVCLLLLADECRDELRFVIGNVRCHEDM